MADAAKVRIVSTIQKVPKISTTVRKRHSRWPIWGIRLRPRARIERSEYLRAGLKVNGVTADRISRSSNISSLRTV
jgi:hypothetical protein